MSTLQNVIGIWSINGLLLPFKGEQLPHTLGVQGSAPWTEVAVHRKLDMSQGRTTTCHAGSAGFNGSHHFTQQLTLTYASDNEQVKSCIQNANINAKRYLSF